MKTQSKEVKGKIVSHRRITGEYYRMRIVCPEISRHALPGQFIMLRVQEGCDPFLRRPFSFSRIFRPPKKGVRGEFEGGVEICYQVVGRGTERMTHLKAGEKVDVLGPLGRGFWREEGRGERLILVGGGMGIAPLLPWAEQLSEKRKARRREKSEEFFQIEVLLGAKKKEGILGRREFKNMGLDPQIATEDGSLGISGMVTDLLERELLTQGHDHATIYACGPMIMLARVAQVAEQFDVPCQVLLESRMACGVGACLGCAVKIREKESRVDAGELPMSIGKTLCDAGEGPEAAGQEDVTTRISEPPSFRYGQVCKEGPVFRGIDILWE
jgi:dihydroorotate dehydrogenase electron transfer subunit